MSKKVPKGLKGPKPAHIDYLLRRKGELRDIGLAEDELAELVKEEWQLLPKEKTDRLRGKYREKRKEFVESLDEINQMGLFDWMEELAEKRKKSGREGGPVERPIQKKKKTKKTGVVRGKKNLRVN